MKYVDEFRDPGVAERLTAAIAREADPARAYRLMEFCGGHTHTVYRYGLEDLLPPNVRLVHGPGCPICVLPRGRVENAVRLARTAGVTLCSYGDMLRVPGVNGLSLSQARACGADVRVVYSPLDAVRWAEACPDRQVVFFAVGFETTAPATAMAVREAHRLGLRNFTVFCNHVLTPSGIQNLLESPDLRKLGEAKIDGFIGPAHVSVVIGSRAYEYFAEEYGRPVVIAGFEPLDVLQAIRMLVRQIHEGRHEVENEYVRAVTREGNRAAQAVVAEVFELRRSFEWRGLGRVPYGAFRLGRTYAAHDAEVRFDLPWIAAPDPAACRCGAILRGLAEPEDCGLFGTACTPENPIGSCMVSPEGACAACITYRSGGHGTEFRP